MMPRAGSSSTSTSGGYRETTETAQRREPRRRGHDARRNCRRRPVARVSRGPLLGLAVGGARRHHLWIHRRDGIDVPTITRTDVAPKRAPQRAAIAPAEPKAVDAEHS